MSNATKGWIIIVLSWVTLGIICNVATGSVGESVLLLVAISVVFELTHFARNAIERKISLDRINKRIDELKDWRD